jgi:hypothetical protein
MVCNQSFREVFVQLFGDSDRIGLHKKSRLRSEFLAAPPIRPEGPLVNSHAREGVEGSACGAIGPKDRQLKANKCRTFGALVKIRVPSPRPDGAWLLTDGPSDLF